MKLELEYFTIGSVVYGIIPLGGQIHIHFCRNDIVHVTIIIANIEIDIEELVMGFEDKLFEHFGLIRKNDKETEIYLTVFYSGERVANYPFIWESTDSEIAMQGLIRRLEEIKNNYIIKCKEQ